MEIKDVFEFVTEYLMKTLLKNFLRKRTMLARHTMSTSLSTILNFKNVLKQKKKLNPLRTKLSYVLFTGKKVKRKIRVRAARRKKIVKRIINTLIKKKKKLQIAVYYPLLL